MDQTDEEYSEEHRQILEKAASLSAHPEILAYEALCMILGESIHTIPETGDEVSFDEEEYLESFYIDLSNARLEGNPDEVAKFERELEKAETYLKNRKAIGDAFYEDLSDILSAHPTSPRILKVTRRDPGGNIFRTLLLRSSVLKWKSTHVGANVNLLDISDANENSESERTLELNLPPDTAWEDIEIRLYSDQRIAFYCKRKKIAAYSYQEVGFTNKKTNKPNTKGAILLGISRGQKFPKNKHPKDTDKTQMTNLRKLLKQIAGLESEPFHDINDADGWRPKFKITDKTNLKDKREKERAKFTDDDIEELGTRASMDFEDEDDDAGKFLRESKN